MSAVDSQSSLSVVWPLAETMAEVRRLGASGRLVVESETAVRDFVFVNGELRAARSNRDDEHLGSWLVAAGLIDDDDVAMGLLAQVKESASPLGHLLVQRGVVSQSELEMQLGNLAQAIVERCANEEPLDVEFAAGPTEEQADTLLATSTAQMILVAARANRDQAGMLARLGSLERPARLVDSLEAVMYDGGFTAAELSVLQRIERVPAVADLEWIMSADPSEMISALYALVAAGYLVIGEAPAPQVAAEVKQSEPSSTRFDSSDAAYTRAPASKAAEVYRRCAEIAETGNIPEAFVRLESYCDANSEAMNLVYLARFMRKYNVATRRVLETLQQALERDPELAEGWFELALFWRRHTSLERERKALTRVLHFDPGHVEARQRLGEL